MFSTGPTLMKPLGAEDGRSVPTPSAAGSRALDCLRRGPIAWRSPEELAIRLGWDIETTKDELAELDAQGWIDVWEREFDLVVTLSAWGAERLGLRLIELGRDECPRWVSVGDPDPPPVRIPPGTAGIGRLDGIADPSPTPEQLMELAEAPPSSRHGKHRRPTIFVGLSLVPWPGPQSLATNGTCPGCESRPLRPDAYCLCCDRWGGDTKDAPRSDNPSTVKRARDTTRDAMWADRARKRRREKHRALMAARMERAKQGTSMARARPSRRAPKPLQPLPREVGMG